MADQEPVEGYDPEQLEKDAAVVEEAVAFGLEAAAASVASDIGQQFVAGPADAVTVPGVWAQIVEDRIAPLISDIIYDTAETIRLGIADAGERLYAGDPIVPTEVLDPQPIADVTAEALLNHATNRMQDIGNDLWLNIQQTLAEGVARGESIPELAERVRQAAPMTEPRARIVARTEVVAASNQAAIAQARSAGVPMSKTWANSLDDRVRRSHVLAEGQTVPIDEPFMVGDPVAFPLDVPCDPAGPPQETIACRCVPLFSLLRTPMEPTISSAHLFTCREGNSKTGKVLHKGPCAGWRSLLPETDPRHPKNSPPKRAASPAKASKKKGKSERELREEIEAEYEDKSRRRVYQANLLAARALVEMAAEVEELVVKGASEKGILHTLRVRMKSLRLEPQLKAGEKVKYDPRQHDLIGGPSGADEGKEALVVRPGYTWKVPSGDVLIERPLVQTSIMELILKAMRPGVELVRPHLFTCTRAHGGPCLPTAARRPRVIKNPEFEKKIHRDLFGRFGDEPDVPAPKKRAPRKATTPKSTPVELAHALRSGQSPDESRAQLSKLTVGELGAVADQLGRKLSGKTKAQKIDSLMGISSPEDARLHAARERQARIDGVRAPGQIAAMVVESAAGGSDLESTKNSARAIAVRLATKYPFGSAAAENALRMANAVQGADSPGQLDGIARRLVAEMGGELIGTPDDIVPYDARRHSLLPGERARKGQKVAVIRPEVRWSEEPDVTLEKAHVYPLTAAELRARTVPTGRRDAREFSVISPDEAQDIEVPKGIKAAYVDAATSFGNEQEMILAPGTSFKVADIKKDPRTGRPVAILRALSRRSRNVRDAPLVVAEPTVATCSGIPGVHLFTCMKIDQWNPRIKPGRCKLGPSGGAKSAAKRGAKATEGKPGKTVPKPGKGAKNTVAPRLDKAAVAKAFTRDNMDARQKQLEDEYKGRTVGDLFGMKGKELEDTVRGIFDGEYGNLNVSVHRVHRLKEGGEHIQVLAYITDRDGNRMGRMERILGRNDDGSYTAEHSMLEINPELQGQGTAERINAKLFGWYRGSRVKNAKLTANIDVGAYAWASAGWDLATEDDAKKVAGYLRASASKFGDKQQAQAARDMADRLESEEFGSPAYPTAREVSQLGRKPGQGKADKWIGKDALLGVDKEYKAVMEFEYA